MKISHLSHRFLVGLGLAAMTIALPTAALAASGSSAAPGLLAAPPCTAAHTTVWMGFPADSGMSHQIWQLQFSNIGTSACTFYGYPGVSELNYSAKQVGLPATHGGTKLLVTLAPGGTAHVVLVVVSAGVLCGSPVKGVTLRVYAPGQTAPHLVPFGTQVCPGKSNMGVDAMHPGAGIPFYSNS